MKQLDLEARLGYKLTYEHLMYINENAIFINLKIKYSFKQVIIFNKRSIRTLLLNVLIIFHMDKYFYRNAF